MSNFSVALCKTKIYFQFMVKLNWVRGSQIKRLTLTTVKNHRKIHVSIL